MTGRHEDRQLSAADWQIYIGRQTGRYTNREIGRQAVGIQHVDTLVGRLTDTHARRLAGIKVWRLSHNGTVAMAIRLHPLLVQLKCTSVFPSEALALRTSLRSSPSCFMNSSTYEREGERGREKWRKRWKEEKG